MDSVDDKNIKEGMKLGSVNGEVPQRVEGMGGECDRNILYTCMKVSKNKLKIY